jgi:hypothetical protein
MPQASIKEYETGLEEGGILMGVRLRNEDDATHLRQQ